MNFVFSGRGLDRREHRLQRFFEMMPGATSWLILIGMLALSFWRPVAAAVLIIAFDFYWLLRLFYVTLFLVIAYLRLSIERETDWMKRIHGIDRLVAYLDEQDRDRRKRGLQERISQWIHKRDLRALRDGVLTAPASKDVRHLVIFPVSSESREVVEPGLRSVIQGKFPAGQILLVIALEERAPAQIHASMQELRQKYRGDLMDLLVTVHPDHLPGEARVKGANVTFAAKQAAAYLQEKRIPFENVIVSCFDADTVVSPDYFSCLTYRFMVCPERTQASFQPIPVYHNNIWEVPGFARILEMGSSFFQLIEATNPEKLVTFSSHSMSFKALVDVDYWPVDMISDDSAIFWKAFIHFDGKYRVVPMYVTLSMDVVAGKSWWKTIRNVYKQKRRWAWGVENFPIVMRGFLRNRKIPLYDRLRHGFKLFEGHVAWATWAFLLTVVGWIPALFAGREFSSSVLYYSAPRITGVIFNLASVALVATIFLSWCLLPRKKEKNPLLNRLLIAIEWLLVPVVITFLSALPALDAQTRLMMGKYMEFWVSEKSKTPDKKR